MRSLGTLRSLGVAGLLLGIGIGPFLSGAGCARRPDSSLAMRRAALTSCLPKSVTVVPTTGYAYDRAGRQSFDRDAMFFYDVWNQLREVRPLATAFPKYNDGRPVVPEKHTYGFDGMRTSTTTNPGAANATVRVQFTPDDVVHDGRREHYVRIGDRIVARLAMNGTGVAALPPGGDDHRLNPNLRREWRVAGADKHFPVALLAFAVVVLAMLASGRRRARWGASLAGIIMLAGSCGILGVYDSEKSSSLILAETFYYHNGLGAGPTLITQQDGSTIEERRYEPFGAPIDAYRSGRGVAAVDLVKDPQSIVGKQTDTSNGFTDHGARWLTPFSARWLTPDPAMRAFDKKFLEAPWDIQPYGYAKENPLALWDPDGRCSSPIGLQPGEVGICFEAFIATKWLPGRIPGGRGDDRTFAADDPTKTSRFQVRLRIDPLAKAPVTSEETTHHVSGFLWKNHGFDGDVSVLRSVEKSSGGAVDLTYDVSATNGPKRSLGYRFRLFLPDELEEPIDMTLKLRVTLGGKVSIVGGGIDAYPSYGVYGYRVQKDGSVKSFELFHFSETTIDKLKPPLDDDLPQTKPQ